MFLSKSKMIVGASTAVLFTLQGCSSNDDSTTPDLGTSCTVGGNQCDGGPEGLVCREFTGPSGTESYCTLPCEDGALGSCEQGEAGSTDDFECDAPAGGSGFCEKVPGTQPAQGTQLGDKCRKGDKGACGQGEETPSDFVCIEDWREAQKGERAEQYCSEECTIGEEGSCGNGEATESDFECVKKGNKVGAKAYCIKKQGE